MAASEELEFDVIVAGTGCSGMAAAVVAASCGLRVLVVEKEPVFGGTTARSGGWLWLPNTPLAADDIEDTPEAVRTYLQHEAGEHFDAARVAAFIDNAPKAVEFFTSRTAVRFDCPPRFPDYHAERPGGMPGGRSMVTRPFDGRELGEFVHRIGRPLPELTVFGMMLGSGQDIVHFMRATKSLRSFAYVARRLSKHALEVLRYGRGMLLTNGNALAGRLAKSAHDLGIPIWLNAPLRDLIRDGDHVVGAVVERDGEAKRIRARCGVVLACGGFPHDAARRRRLFPHREHHSPAPRGNTGDGLRLAETAGAQIDTSLPHPAAWVPVSLVPRKDGSQGIMPHFIDRAKPGVIAVLRNGRRFTNEANSYHDFIRDMLRALPEGEEQCAYLIADHRALRRYGLGCVPPAPLPSGRYLKTGYLKRGATLEALAQQAGIDPAALRHTVDEFNRHAASGEDPAFGKGTKAYNRQMGDPFHPVNPCVAPLERGPFYAIKMVIGDLGTFAGITTDERTRVLGDDGNPIPGLHAVGNDMTSIMGGEYPGAGITLGPGLTFGYIAGQELAQRKAHLSGTGTERPSRKARA